MRTRPGYQRARCAKELVGGVEKVEGQDDSGAEPEKQWGA